MKAQQARRPGIAAALVLALAFAAGPVRAEGTRLRFTLDWIPGAVHGPFLIAHDQGYYRAEGLDVTIDRGKGSAEVVRELASGAYDLGFPDINMVMQFEAQNPGKAPVEVMMGYDQAPASIFVLKSGGIAAPKGLEGRVLGAAANDSTFKLFPIFAKFAGFDAGKVKVKYIEPSLRETLLAKHEVDAIAAQMFNAMLELKAKGVKEDAVRYFMYKDYGLDLYANGVAVSRAFLAQHPDAVRGFLRATLKGVRDMVRDPESAVTAVTRFEPLLDPAIERERLRLAMACCIVTPYVLKEGYGGIDPARLDRSFKAVAEAYGLARVPAGSEVFDASYLPPAPERMVK